MKEFFGGILAVLDMFGANNRDLDSYLRHEGCRVNGAAA